MCAGLAQEPDDAKLPAEKHAKTDGTHGADIVRLLSELPDSPTKTALLEALLAMPSTAVPAPIGDRVPAVVLREGVIQAMPSPAGDPAAPRGVIPAPAAVPPQGVIPTMPSPAGDPAAVPPQGVIPTTPSPPGDPAAAPPQGVIPTMPSPPGDPAAVPPQGVIPAMPSPPGDPAAVLPQGVIPAMPSPPGDPAAVPPQGVIPAMPSPAGDPVSSNVAAAQSAVPLHPAGSLPAVMAPSQPTAAPVLPAPPTLVQASSVHDQQLVPHRGGGWLCNSKTHAAEWKSYGRWIVRNPDATQLSAAFNKGSDARLGAFQKWVHSGGNGKAVEACMRMTRSSEELHKDSGRYVTWTMVLQHFKNDATQAMDFAAKRRNEEKGVSKCRNTGQETFLLFNDEMREWTERKLEAWCDQIGKDVLSFYVYISRSSSAFDHAQDEVAIEVGADLEAATQLAQLISFSPQLFRKSVGDDKGRDNDNEDADGEATTTGKAEADKNNKPPKPKAKTKPKAKAKAGSSCFAWAFS